MPQSAIENLIHENMPFAIHCTTESQAVSVLISFYHLNMKWYNNTPIVYNGQIDTFWNKNKKNTCYLCDTENNTIRFAKQSYYNNKNIKIFEYESLIDSQNSYGFIDEFENVEKVSDDNAYIDTPTIKNNQIISNNETVYSELKDEEELVKISNDMDESDEENSYNEDLPLLCSVFNVKVNQPFKCMTQILQLNNKIFRINQQGTREQLVNTELLRNPINNFWKQCNDEFELSVLIQMKGKIRCL